MLDAELSQKVHEAIFDELVRVGADLSPEEILDALAFMLVSYARFCEMPKFDFINAVDTVWDICGASEGEMSDVTVGDA